MAPANTANLTRNTTTDRKTPSRFHQFAPGARHQTDVVFPPNCDSPSLCGRSCGRFGVVVWRQVLADDRVSLLVMEAEFGRPLFHTTACGD
jgi:hypothetical protein